MRLRRISEDDLKLRVMWMNSPSIYNHMHYDLPILYDNTLNWFIKNINSTNRVDLVLEDNGVVVGMGGYTSINKKVRKAELYLFIDPSQHGKGYGFKLMSMLLDYGFLEVGLLRIYLEVDESNLAARRLYEKCNLKLEGTLLNDCLRDGKYINRCVYAIVKEL